MTALIALLALSVPPQFPEPPQFQPAATKTINHKPATRCGCDPSCVCPGVQGGVCDCEHNIKRDKDGAIVIHSKAASQARKAGCDCGCAETGRCDCAACPDYTFDVKRVEYPSGVKWIVVKRKDGEGIYRAEADADREANRLNNGVSAFGRGRDEQPTGVITTPVATVATGVRVVTLPLFRESNYQPRAIGPSPTVRTAPAIKQVYRQPQPVRQAIQPTYQYMPAVRPAPVMMRGGSCST